MRYRRSEFLGRHMGSVYAGNMRVFVALFAVALAPVTLACGGDDDSKDGSGGTGGGSTICERGCVATLAANCPIGPPDQASCVSTCESYSTGDCKEEYGAFQTCAEGKPITCNATGIPFIEACAAEQNAFIACLSS
jgi:hypothetical protein